MDINDRRAIEELFYKLDKVERSSGATARVGAQGGEASTSDAAFAEPGGSGPT